MDRIVPASVILIVALIGFIYIFQRVKQLADNRQSANDFRDKLNAYLNSQGQDYQTYSWLIHRSSRIQSEMGPFGIVGALRPPYADYIYRNYPIVFNSLREIRRGFEDDRFLRNTRALCEYGALLNESVLRYIGALDDLLELERKGLRNPFVWLQDGVKQILLLPFTLLFRFGVMGGATIDTVARNPVFRILSGLVALLSVLSAIITIVVGWEPFINIVRQVIAH